MSKTEQTQIKAVERGTTQTRAQGHTEEQLQARYDAIGKDWCPACTGWGAKFSLDNPWAMSPCQVCKGIGLARASAGQEGEGMSKLHLAGCQRIIAAPQQDLPCNCDEIRKHAMPPAMTTPSKPDAGEEELRPDELAGSFNRDDATEICRRYNLCPKLEQANAKLAEALQHAEWKLRDILDWVTAYGPDGNLAASVLAHADECKSALAEHGQARNST